MRIMHASCNVLIDPIPVRDTLDVQWTGFYGSTIESLGERSLRVSSNPKNRIDDHRIGVMTTLALNARCREWIQDGKSVP